MNKNEYIALGWPQVQQYMKDYFEDIGYDPKMNLWFVPKKYIK